MSLSKSRRKRTKFAKTQAPTSSVALDKVVLDIDNLSYEGRGIAVYNTSSQSVLTHQIGKKVFVDFALPSERVEVVVQSVKKRFDEAYAINIIHPSPHRTQPICQHFEVCGGCRLQHFAVTEQVKFKQSVLQNQLEKFGIKPMTWLSPIQAVSTQYRTKARLGVRYLPKTDTLIVGFRQKNSNFLMQIDECPILDRRVGDYLGQLQATLQSLQAKADIGHIHIAMGDPDETLPSVAMVIRHLKPLCHTDQTTLKRFAKTMNWQVWLQSDRLYRLDEQCPSQGLRYRLPKFEVVLQSRPTDFTQVNLEVNRQMVALACELLQLQAGERVLDLFCGIGNFSLALAKCVGDTGQVIGVEGDADMVAMANQNADANGLHNVQFFAQDLTQDFADKSWVGQVDALLIDPPRSGAWEVMAYLGRFDAKRIVYVSCDVATLARDSACLIAQGYRLTHAGVMDMFCHTAHVESIVRFEKELSLSLPKRKHWLKNDKSCNNSLSNKQK